MAYVLGFFAADGSMLKNNRGAHYIEFQITDKEIITAIQRVIGSNHKVTERKRGDTWKTVYRLQIGSKTWFEDLERLGFVQSKSRVLILPRIPHQYHGPFVRGYFDGDGGVYFKKYKAKDRRKLRWTFSSRFTSGSLLFIRSLHRLLNKHGVHRGFVIVRKGSNAFDLVLSHRDSLALYCLMYNNAPRIYLKRKYRTFKRAVTTLYGNNCGRSSTG